MSAVAGQPAAVGVEGDRVVNLFPERHARVGTEEHQRRPRLAAILAGHQPVDLVGPVVPRVVVQLSSTRWR